MISAGKPVAGKADGCGLTFTMSEKQARGGEGSWVFRYRLDGRQHELTIGNYPAISLEAARVLASSAFIRVHEGIDVAREKQIYRHGVPYRLRRDAKSVEVVAAIDNLIEAAQVLRSTLVEHGNAAD